MSEALHRYLVGLPKMELHLHLEGSVLPATAVDLSRKNSVALPSHTSPDDLYHYDNLGDFLKIYAAVAASMRDADDFRRVTYEMLSSSAANGARYVEFFFSPHVHLEEGVPFPVQIDGVLRGMKDADTDFGLISRIIPGINREAGPAAGQEMLDLILAHRPDELIGIGLDFNEAPFPPEPFAEVFANARRAGLHTTSHAGETGPAAYVRGSVQALGSERIDHGYRIVEDRQLMQQCKDAGILFTVCPSTSAVTSPWHDLSSPDHAIRQMLDFGLKLCINSDDPPMFFTDLGQEYIKCVEHLGFTLDDITNSILAGIEGSWLDETTRKQWSRDWTAEIAEARRRFENR